MKQLFCIIMSLLLVLSLCACAPKNQDTTQPTVNTQESEGSTTEPTAETTIPNISVNQMPLIAVSLPVVSESVTADDGNEIFRYTFQNMSLTMPDAEVADKIVLNFLNRVDATRSTAEGILSLAEGAYKSGSNWTPYQCVISYEPMRLDLGILSMLGSHTTYSGAPHPETVYEVVNYDLLTGKTLSIQSIMDFDKHIDTLFEYVLEDLENKAEEKFLFEGFEDTVDELKGSSQLNNHWYFSPEGLCVFFPPYEIAPYSSGVVTATVPYEKLTGILNDAYFPGERENVPGELSVIPFAQESTIAFTQIAELIVDSESTGDLLYTQTALYDIRIDLGTLSANGENFTKQQTIFAASSLTPGDAIMIAPSLAEATPNLRVQYYSGEKLHTAYISSDGTHLTLQLS